MKVEKKDKRELNLSIDDIYAFKVDVGIGFISEGNEYFVIWWEGNDYPSVCQMIKPNTNPTLKECLVASDVLDEDDDIIEIYDENEFELVLREL